MLDGKLDRNSPTQLCLKLEPVSRYGLEYFIPHSGVSHGVGAFRNCLDIVLSHPAKCRMVYLFGAKGTGKTHLLKGFELEARGRGLLSENLLFCDGWLSDENSRDDEIAEFVCRYQQIKARGGLIAVSSRFSPQSLTKNPHVLSRALSGLVVELHYPREEELRPLIVSLLERENLRISERSLDALVRLIPANPLSCEEIFSKLNDVLSTTGMSAGERTIREVIRSLSIRLSVI